MKVTQLAWYITGALALLGLFSSLMTFIPEPGEEPPNGAASLILFGPLVVMGIFVLIRLGRLPQDHWVHHSKLLSVFLAFVAITLTLLVISVG